MVGFYSIYRMSTVNYLLQKDSCKNESSTSIGIQMRSKRPTTGSGSPAQRTIEQRGIDTFGVLVREREVILQKC